MSLICFVFRCASRHVCSNCSPFVGQDTVWCRLMRRRRASSQSEFFQVGFFVVGLCFGLASEKTEAVKGGRSEVCQLRVGSFPNARHHQGRCGVSCRVWRLRQEVKPDPKTCSCCFELTCGGTRDTARISATLVLSGVCFRIPAFWVGSVSTKPQALTVDDRPNRWDEVGLVLVARSLSCRLSVHLCFTLPSAVACSICPFLNLAPIVFVLVSHPPAMPDEKTSVAFSAAVASCAATLCIQLPQIINVNPALAPVAVAWAMAASFSHLSDTVDFAKRSRLSLSMIVERQTSFARQVTTCPELSFVLTSLCSQVDTHLHPRLSAVVHLDVRR